MVALMCAYSATVLAYYVLTAYFAGVLTVAIILTLVYIYSSRHYFLLLWLFIGCGCALLRIFFHPLDLTDTTIQAHPVLASGTVLSIPSYHHHAVRFNFSVHEINHHPVQQRLQLSWYGSHPYVQVRDDWQFVLRFKKSRIKPRYRRWLRANQLQAQAYVAKSADDNHLIKRRQAYQSIHVARQVLGQKIRYSVKNPDLSAILVALSTGARNFLTAQHWRVFQNTGTSHLIAISGLHVSLVAGLVYWIAQYLWRRSVRLMRCIATSKAASLIALLVTLLYASIAGWSLPTQRAVLMLAVMLLAVCYHRHVPLWYRWLFALTLTLVLWPTASLSVGFWLSYVAVFVIAFCFSARLQAQRGLMAWLYLQYAMFLGLLPLSLLFFGRLSLLMVIANCVAVPYMTAVVVPACLLATLSFFIVPVWSHYIWTLAAWLLSPLWWLLTQLANLPHAVWYHALHQSWIVFSLCLGILLLLLPRCLPIKALAVIFMLPLFFQR